MVARVLQKGFGAGEITSSLFARSDLDQYKMGATKIENLIVLPQGAIRSRGGFAYCGQAIDSTQPVRLLPFRYSSDQVYVLEFGHRTVRLWTNGSIVLNNDGTPYVITSPYDAKDLKNIDFSQNADILTLTNPDYKPYELRRYNTTDWRFVEVQMSPTLDPPSSISSQAVYASYMTDAETKTKDKLSVRYVVTALDEMNKESVASVIVNGSGNYYITGAKIRVSWSAVTGATYYRVYREVAGIFGFIGETEELYLDDVGNNPDTSTTPPKYKEIFSSKTSNQIASVSVADGGNGYFYGLFNSDYYLPRNLTIDCLPTIKCEFDSLEEANLYAPTIKLNIINGTTGATYINPFNNIISYQSFVETITDEETEETSYVKYIYLNSSFNVRLTNDVLSIPNALIKLSITDIGDGEIYFSNHDERLVRAYNLKDNQDFIDFYDANGIYINNFRELFTQNDTTVQLPMNVTDSQGSGAKCYAVANNGSVSSVTVTNSGSEYSQNTSVSITSNIGSGATFTVNRTNGTSPDYPSSVAQYDQRRVFAGSYNNPLKVWFTNAGYQDMMVYHHPILADDRIEIVAVTSDADRIKHIISLDSLLLLTGSSELRVFTQNSDSLTPQSVAVRPQSFVGANNVQPVIVNNTIVYACNRGGHIRALGYDYSQQGYITNDISVRSPHLFDGKEIQSLTLGKSPIQIVWAVSSDGMLLGCSYLPEQNQIAWHRHTTLNGRFESVCCVSEGSEDHLYAIVNRNGVRCIERMSNFMVSEYAEYYRYLDSYLDANFTSLTKTVQGLNHLEGQTVSIFADGKQQTNKVVANGKVTLDTAAKNIAIGLPITNEFISVPLIANYESELQGRTKNIGSLYLRVSYEGELYACNYPSGQEWKCSKVDEYLKTKGSESYLVKVQVDGEWTEQSMFKVIHKQATPIEIQSIILDINYEGGK